MKNDTTQNMLEERTLAELALETIDEELQRRLAVKMATAQGILDELGRDEN